MTKTSVEIEGSVEEVSGSCSGLGARTNGRRRMKADGLEASLFGFVIAVK